MTPQHADPRFWQGKKVLMTGHTGFKGSWLSLWLQALGADLLGIALEPPTRPSLFEVANVARGMDHQLTDIRDFAAVSAQMERLKPEIVFHLAAQPLVRASYQQPVETYSTNVMGTLHVLEAARGAGSVRAIVNITTDKVYENREWLWSYREDEPLGGSDPYSSSKACAELISAAYRRSFLAEAGIALATARAGNVIGGGDWAPDRLVPDVLQALERGEPILVRNPRSIRPWQHVLEPLSGYLCLAESLHRSGQQYAEAWNFGPATEDARSVEWVVDRLCRAWGTDSSSSPQAGWHPHEAACLKLDSSKARERLQWTPIWPLETALAKTAKWHRAWLSGQDMHHHCLAEIGGYAGDGFGCITRNERQ